jgi:hypothetical protein
MMYYADDTKAFQSCKLWKITNCSPWILCFLFFVQNDPSTQIPTSSSEIEAWIAAKVCTKYLVKYSSEFYSLFYPSVTLTV